MPAREIHVGHAREVREKIKTGCLVNRLNNIALGKIDATPAQMKAMEIALRKTLPDLSNITISGDEKNPLNAVVRFGWMPTKS